MRNGCGVLLASQRALINAVDNETTGNPTDRLEGPTIGLPFLFSGNVASHDTDILLDSGCTANVVSRTFCDAYRLQTEPCPQVPVAFANGAMASFEEQVTVTVKVGNWNRNITCFVGSVDQDLILGVPWIASVVISQLDWSKGVMEFVDAGNTHKWIGLTHLRQMPTLIRACELHTLSRSAMIYAVTVQQQQPSVGSPSPELQQLVSEFADVFQEPTSLPPPRQEDIEINLMKDAPIPKWRSLPRLSAFELGVLREKIDDLLKKGYIRPSTSPFGASILFVKKADGSLRLCVDYRGLNDITIKNRCPIPNIAELRERVAGATIFSKLDLREGYYNLGVAEKDVHKTAFRSRYGHFEFKVMPFGLTNAPAVFQAMINRIFRPLLDRFVIAYLDDIVIYSRNLTEHIEHVRTVFTAIRTHKLALKLSKCQFGSEEVAFCGHMMGKKGIAIQADKKAAMAVRPIITGPSDIKTWLGSCVWFKDFIPGFARITQPLTNLTRKGVSWLWNSPCEDAVTKLINAITTAPVLRHFDPSRETHLFTDASLFAIGGWLAQTYTDGRHPVVYWSRKLLPAEQNYPVHERELLALVEMVDRFGHLLRGVAFTAWTDHRALKWIQTQPNLSYRQARWVLALQEFEFKVEYLPGKFNNVADYLSRSPLVSPHCARCGDKITVGAIKVTSGPSLTRQITLGLRGDTWAQQLFTAQVRVKQSKASSADAELLDGYQLKRGLWYFGTRIYVPDVETIRTTLLERYHDGITAGHQGLRRTLERLSRFYYWPGIQDWVKDYVKSCDTCQRFNPDNQKPIGVLHPLPVPSRRFVDIAMDFASLPTSQGGFDSVLVVIDRLTKLCAFLPGHRTDTAEMVADRFMTGWYCKGAGLPNSIVSDRDSRFLSAFWKSICAKLGIKQDLTTARHQQADGQAERSIGIMKSILRKYVSHGNLDWDLKLPFVEFAVNNSISTSTGFTPFYLAYGHNPREPEDLETEEDCDLLQKLSKVLLLTRDNMYHAQDLQSLDFDRRHTTPKTLQVGDLVLLAADGISWPVDVQHPPSFSPKWLGPFPIRDCTEASRNNYELILPPSLSKLHPVFHASKLRLYRISKRFPSRKSTTRPDPVFGADGRARYEVDRILDKRLSGKGKSTRVSYLVKWVGYPEHESDWIPYTDGDPEWEEDRHKILAFEGIKMPRGVSR